MEIVLLTDIEKTLSLKDTREGSWVNSLCKYVIDNSGCTGINCSVCPFEMNETKLNTTQKKLDKLITAGAK